MTVARAPAFAAAAALPLRARGRRAYCGRREMPVAAASRDAAAAATPHVPSAFANDSPASNAPAIEQGDLTTLEQGDPTALEQDSPPVVACLADVDEIVRLADEFDLGDIRIESGGVTVEITRTGGRGFVNGVLREPPPPVVAAPPLGTQVTVQDDSDDGAVQDVEAAEVEVADEDEPEIEEEKPPADPNVVYDSDFVVTSNRVGFFFSGARNKPPLVNVGDHVAFNQPVCIIEQLGQQYVYLSEVSGTVTKIFVEDGDSVQYDQQVMVIRPD